MSELNAAYRERNAVVAALIRSNGWPAEVVMAPDTEGWWIVYAETPSGQVSWHISPDDMDLFRDWPVAFGSRPSPWDGHTTAEKYDRLAALRAVVPTDEEDRHDVTCRAGQGPCLIAPALPDGLDVERLARALRVIDTRRTVEQNAPLVAAEYAALTTIPETGEGLWTKAGRALLAELESVARSAYGCLPRTRRANFPAFRGYECGYEAHGHAQAERGYPLNGTQRSGIRGGSRG